MMNFYPENYDVLIAVPYTDASGAEISPDSASAVLLDGDGVQVADLGVIDSSGTSHNLIVPGTHNELPVGERFAIRILEVSIVYSSGTLKRRFSYAVETNVKLQIMENSFMGYEYAFIVANEFVNKAAWMTADEGTRKTALVDAFNRLTRIPMKWNPRDENGNPIREIENVIDRDLWIEINLDAFALFPTHFKRALRRAQFVEANALLTGDVIAEKRRAGILSETVGESSVRLSNGILDFGISSETMDVLTGYLHFDLRIVRS